MPFPNKIKYSTALTAGTIKAGNFLIGVNIWCNQFQTQCQIPYYG
jgi:hypothetical protein